tara:strand:- start:1109 stop:2533 length:1425 start_codon:yes stop_codon:yes gene_type:complete
MNTRAILGFVILSLGLACGAPAPLEDGASQWGCTSEADCQGVQTCSLQTGQCEALEPGACRQDDPLFCACTDDVHCPEGLFCGRSDLCEELPASDEPEAGSNGEPEPRPNDQDPEPVAACEQDRDCPITQFCDDLINACGDLPDGMCREDAQCASNNCFVRQGRDVGRCLETSGCTSDAECGGRQACRQAECVDVECSQDRHCGAGSSCQNNRCVARERDDDHGNTFETATVIEDMSTTRGVIDYGGDRDVFRIEATVTGRYVVETTGQTDTVCTVLTTDDNILETNDDDGEGNNCSLAFEGRQGATYQVQVSGYRDRTGSYTLVLIRLGEGENNGAANGGGAGDNGGVGNNGGEENPGVNRDPEDQGADANSAQTVQLPAEIPAQLSPSDEDWFRFTTEGAGRYRLETRSRLDTDCKLLDEAENQVGTSDDDGQMLNCRIEIPLEAATTYFFAVRGYTSNITGPYTAVLTALD